MKCSVITTESFTPVQYFTSKMASPSVVVLEESLCPRGPIYKFLVLWPQSPWKLSTTLHSQTVCYVLVTEVVHEVTVKNGLLTDIRYYLLSNKPSFTVTLSFWQSMRKVLILEDPLGPISKSLSLSSDFKSLSSSSSVKSLNLMYFTTILATYHCGDQHAAGL